MISNCFEAKAKKLIGSHGCEFIGMTSECSVVWKNKIGITRVDDIFALSMMSDTAWEFWCYN